MLRLVFPCTFLAFLGCLWGVGGCARTPAEALGHPASASASEGATPQASAARRDDSKVVAMASATARPSKVEAFGTPIRTGETVALSAIAKDPTTFRGKSIATAGTVKAVCQERGCWMEIVDDQGHANVRMHGHSFFIPKNASGRRARVEATVVLVKDGHECDEMAATGAQLELDATGVELL